MCDDRPARTTVHADIPPSFLGLVDVRIARSVSSMASSTEVGWYDEIASFDIKLND